LPAILASAAASNINVIEEDFIKINYLVEDDIARRLKKLGEYLVFTSKNAVAGLIANIEKTGVHLPAKKIFCLSGETRKAVDQLKKKEILGVASNAAELAKLIIREKPVTSLDFICGKQRRDELPDILAATGIKVIEHQLYETVLTGRLINANYDGVVFFSPSGVESYFQTNKLPKGGVCFCIGHTTAGSVKDHTKAELIVAEEASQKGLMDTVIKFYKQTIKL
jgi:uroporphyrinogen-III synthase